MIERVHGGLVVGVLAVLVAMAAMQLSGCGGACDVVKGVAAAVVGANLHRATTTAPASGATEQTRYVIELPAVWPGPAASGTDVLIARLANIVLAVLAGAASTTSVVVVRQNSKLRRQLSDQGQGSGTA